jgi:hypothetical protein
MNVKALLRRPLVTTTGIWCVLTMVYGYATVREEMALPPSAEEYTQSPMYQAITFLGLKFPALFVLLLVVLGFQAFFQHIRASAVSQRGMWLLRGTLYSGIIVIGVAWLWTEATSDLPFNPWFQYDEQILLWFMLKRLPLYASMLGLVLAGELQWLRPRAS